MRPKARYERSLELLQRAKAAAPDRLTKSGLMAGLGETKDELLEVFADLRAHDVDILTLGQYLRPDQQHLPIDRYYHADEFDELGEAARKMGFAHVESGPLVRSSYHAEEQAAPVLPSAPSPPATNSFRSWTRVAVGVPVLHSWRGAAGDPLVLWQEYLTLVEQPLRVWKAGCSKGPVLPEVLVNDGDPLAGGVKVRDQLAARAHWLPRSGVSWVPVPPECCGKLA